jgi:predicted  nucleic acid-binding Zn-ribbon protein
MVGKRKEQEEMARLDDAITQIKAKTEEYRKDLMAKKKQLDEINAAMPVGAE